MNLFPILLRWGGSYSLGEHTTEKMLAQTAEGMWLETVVSWVQIPLAPFFAIICFALCNLEGFEKPIRR